MPVAESEAAPTERVTGCQHPTRHHGCAECAGATVVVLGHRVGADYEAGTGHPANRAAYRAGERAITKHRRAAIPHTCHCETIHRNQLADTYIAGVVIADHGVVQCDHVAHQAAYAVVARTQRGNRRAVVGLAHHADERCRHGGRQAVQETVASAQNRRGVAKGLAVLLEVVHQATTGVVGRVGREHQPARTGGRVERSGAGRVDERHRTRIHSQAVSGSSRRGDGRHAAKIDTQHTVEQHVGTRHPVVDEDRVGVDGDVARRADRRLTGYRPVNGQASVGYIQRDVAAGQVGRRAANTHTRRRAAARIEYQVAADRCGDSCGRATYYVGAQRHTGNAAAGQRQVARDVQRQVGHPGTRTTDARATALGAVLARRRPATGDVQVAGDRNILGRRSDHRKIVDAGRASLQHRGTGGDGLRPHNCVDIRKVAVQTSSATGTAGNPDGRRATDGLVSVNRLDPRKVQAGTGTAGKVQAATGREI